MTDLRQLALGRIPSAIRPEAERVADLLEDGYRTGEIAEALEMSRHRVAHLQTKLQAGMVQALGADGYSTIEAINYLGVPTAMVTAHLASAP